MLVGGWEVETDEIWEEEGEELTDDGAQAEARLLCLCLQEDATGPRGWSG